MTQQVACFWLRSPSDISHGYRDSLETDGCSWDRALMRVEYSCQGVSIIRILPFAAFLSQLNWCRHLTSTLGCAKSKWMSVRDVCKAFGDTYQGTPICWQHRHPFLLVLNISCNIHFRYRVRLGRRCQSLPVPGSFFLHTHTHASEPHLL